MTGLEPTAGRGAAPEAVRRIEAPPPPADLEQAVAAAARFHEAWEELRASIGRAVVGMDEVVEEVLVALFAGGHALLEGVPGLGKTLLVRSLARALELDFGRVQFTADLMPADITGTTVIGEDERTGERVFHLQPGPVFTQLLLADEINRAGARCQAALLEAMQERSVTVGGATRALPRPFLVLATQNPIEQEGTNRLPEAQLDRFLFLIRVAPPRRADLTEVLERTTGREGPEPEPVLGAADIDAFQRICRMVAVPAHVQDLAVRLVLATHPGGEHAPKGLERLVTAGASPRAAQALLSAARVAALADGRFAAGPGDVRRFAAPVLRHRLALTFEAEAERLDRDEVVARIAERVPDRLAGTKASASASASVIPGAPASPRAASPEPDA